MRRAISNVLKKSIWILLVCLFIIYPVTASYETGLSWGRLLVVKADTPTTTYDNWLEGWGTGDVYSGATLSVNDEDEAKDIYEMYMEWQEKKRDWFVDTLEVGLSVIIKVLVVSTATAIVEDLGATIDQVVYGRVATGDDVSKFHFGLEDGNIFGVVGAIIYAILRGFVFALLAIQLLYMIGTYLLKGTGKGRSDLKSGIYDFVFMFVMLYAIPIIVSMILFLRDSMVKKILDVTNTIAGSYSLGIFDMMMVGTAEDFSLAGAIVMACVAAGGLYFAYEYIRMAITQVYLFGSFPMVAFRSFSDKQVFNKWIGHFIVTLFTPVIDAAGLMIVLLLQENMTAISAENGHYGLLMVMAYMCIIPCRNALLQLFGAPVPNRGFSLAAAAMMLSRFIGGKKERPSDDKGEKNGNSQNKPPEGSGGEREKTLQSSTQRTGDDANTVGGPTVEGSGRETSEEAVDSVDTERTSVSTSEEAEEKGVDIEGGKEVLHEDGAASIESGDDTVELSGGEQIIDEASANELAELSSDAPLGYINNAVDTPVGEDVPIMGDGGGAEMPELNGGGQGNGVPKIDEEKDTAEPILSDESASVAGGTSEKSEIVDEGGGTIEKDVSGEFNGDESVGRKETVTDAELENWQNGASASDKCIPCNLSGEDAASGNYVGSRIHEDGSRETLLSEKGGKALDADKLPEGVTYNPPVDGTANRFGSITEDKSTWAAKAGEAMETKAPGISMSDATRERYKAECKQYDDFQSSGLVQGIGKAAAVTGKGIAAGARYVDERAQRVHPDYVGFKSLTPDGKWDYATDLASATRTLSKVTSGMGSVALGGTAAAVMAASGDMGSVISAGMLVGGGAHGAISGAGERVATGIETTAPKLDTAVQIAKEDMNKLSAKMQQRQGQQQNSQHSDAYNSRKAEEDAKNAAQKAVGISPGSKLPVTVATSVQPTQGELRAQEVAKRAQDMQRTAAQQRVALQKAGYLKEGKGAGDLVGATDRLALDHMQAVHPKTASRYMELKKARNECGHIIGHEDYVRHAVNSRMRENPCPKGMNKGEYRSQVEGAVRKECDDFAMRHLQGAISMRHVGKGTTLEEFREIKSAEYKRNDSMMTHIFDGYKDKHFDKFFPWLDNGKK